jgi:transcriptional regulatory protein RtcR
VGLHQQDDFIIKRYEMIYAPRAKKLAKLICEDIKAVSPETEVVLHAMAFRDPWDFEEVFEKLYEFVQSYRFKPDDEYYYANITTGTHVFQICLFLLCESHLIPGKLVQSNPVRKPAPGEPNGDYQIIDLDLSRYNKIAARFRQEAEAATVFLKSGIDTKNAKFNTLINEIEQVATVCNDPILLTGPTGAGKSLLARKIYELKKIKRQLSGQLIEINCATLRGDNAISALFGHTKGAFTGAQAARQGLLKSAHKGLLFLDEIGEMGLDEQAMLLRAIEEKSFLPLGADQAESSDFQLIVGTNRDLWREVRAGTFREDLLARINLWSFALPGLKDRPEDIAPNVDYELKKFQERTGNLIRFNLDARSKFLGFAVKASWLANFRDLNAAVTRMATLSRSGRIDSATVDTEIQRLQRQWNSEGADGKSLLSAYLSAVEIKALDPFDRLQLEGVLQICADSKNLSDAGRKLFSASREKKKLSNDADRLRKYFIRFGIDTGSLWD